MEKLWSTAKKPLERMNLELVPLTFNKIMQSPSYTVMILGTEKKRFAIYMEPSVGEHLQSYMINEQTPRPYTHELINSLLLGFEIKILQVVITDVEDTVYFARIFLEQLEGDNRKIIEIDARPSDALPLALMNNIPLFCRREIFEQTIPIED